MQNPYSADQYPDLSLAMTPDVASGQQETHMPVPLPNMPREQPVLQCSDPGMELNQMGIVVQRARTSTWAWPKHPDLAYQQYPQAINPTFTAPDLTPTIQSSLRLASTRYRPHP